MHQSHKGPRGHQAVNVQLNARGLGTVGNGGESRMMMPESAYVTKADPRSSAVGHVAHRARRGPSTTIRLVVEHATRGVASSAVPRAMSANHSNSRSTATSQRGRAPHTRHRRLGEGQDTARLITGIAAEDRRFGDRQPLRESSIGGPWQLRDRSDAMPSMRPGSIPGHRTASAQAPRHLVGSDAANPRQAGGIGDGSPGKADSLRAAGPRERGA